MEEIAHNKGLRDKTTYNLDKDVSLGLSGTDDSIGYRLAEIEKHFYNSDQVWGLTTSAMARKSIAPIVITGGSGAWGTELMLTDGTVIESGNATKKFDLSRIKVVLVGTANRYTILEFYYSPIGTSVACTFDDAGGAATNIVVSAAHGLTVGDKISFKAGAGALPSGITFDVVYYVKAIAAGYFTLALTPGGAEVDLVDDGGACFWYPISTTTGIQKNTQTLLSECLVSRAANSGSDAISLDIRTPRIPCNYKLYCRGYAAGGTNAVSFFIILHTYAT
jgi:hypothetical protein